MLGSRRNMEDKLTLEYFLSLLDEGERILSGDKFGERHQIVDYELKEKEAVSVEIKEEEESVSKCRNCSLWINRIKYAEPIVNKDTTLMCILASPEGMKILSAPSEDYFLKWINAIGLDISNVSLTTLIKCPSNSFSAEYADSCKIYLRKEMSEIKPKVLLLMGHDVAKYMLRRDLPLDQMRGKRYVINNIPAYVTYSPHDLVDNRTLRVPIWEDLKLLKGAL